MMRDRQPENLTFLDGMRALAMLNVLLFHALTSHPDSQTPNSLLAALNRYCLHGQTGVVVFIVLSGYCLMLPVARSADGALRGGIGGFLRRRSLRILPAYYVVLFASIALVFLVSQMHSVTHATRDSSNILTLRNIVTHLLMVHNLFFDTAFAINGPMWSVATE